MTRRANPAALAAARASAERLHRAIGSEAGMRLAPMTPREARVVLWHERREAERRERRKRPVPAAQEIAALRAKEAAMLRATEMLEAAGVPLEAMGVGMGAGRAA